LSPAASITAASPARPRRATVERSRVDKRTKKKPSRSKPAGLIPTTLGGLLWAAALVAGAATSPLAAAAVVVPVGVVASLSSVRSVSRLHRTRKSPLGALAVAAFLTVLLPVAALGGFAALSAVGVVAGIVASVVAFFLLPQHRPAALLFALLGPGVASASVVLAVVQGWNLALTLVGAVCAYDLACWVYGTRKGIGGWVGVAAGMVTVAVVALFVAAVFVPPFGGARPWVMLGAVATSCPLGVLLASTLIGGDRLPALRRLDSLVLAGPVWVATTALVLHR
jgi:hypothetical protein